MMGKPPTTEELVALMESCFSDENRRQFFPSHVERRLPREVPEGSVLRFTIEVFAHVIGADLFRRDKEAMDEVCPP